MHILVNILKAWAQLGATWWSQKHNFQLFTNMVMLITVPCIAVKVFKCDPTSQTQFQITKFRELD